MSHLCKPYADFPGTLEQSKGHGTPLYGNWITPLLTIDHNRNTDNLYTCRYLSNPNPTAQLSSKLLPISYTRNTGAFLRLYHPGMLDTHNLVGHRTQIRHVWWWVHSLFSLRNGSLPNHQS